MPAQGTQTLSAKGEHAATWNCPLGQAPEHFAQVASAKGVHGVVSNSPAAQRWQAEHTVLVAFAHVVLSNIPGAQRAQAVHVLPSPKEPGAQEHGFAVELSHGGAPSGAPASLGVSGFVF